MIIITIVICLFIERFLSSLSILRNFTWLSIYTDFVLKCFQVIKFNKGKIPVLFIVLPPAIIVGYIDQLLYQTFLPFEFIFSIVILLYCLGPQAFYDRSKALCHAEDINDNACACWYAEKILDRPLNRQDKINLSHVIAQSLFTITNDRILAPIFWFIILGPMGAVLFRASSQLYFFTMKDVKNTQRIELIMYSANFLYAILNWLPSRLSALGFAAMGNFAAVMKRVTTIKSVMFNISQESNDHLLITIGSAAIDLPVKPNETTANKIAEALAILRRNTQLWMGTIAVLTLAGWLS